MEDAAIKEMGVFARGGVPDSIDFCLLRRGEGKAVGNDLDFKVGVAVEDAVVDVLDRVL